METKVVGIFCTKILCLYHIWVLVEKESLENEILKTKIWEGLETCISETKILEV